MATARRRRLPFPSALPASRAGDVWRLEADGRELRLSNLNKVYWPDDGITKGDLLAYYWNVADQYVLFDRFFSSSSSGSVRNAMYWASGTPGNFQSDSIPEGGFGAIPTIFDRLEARGISWKFYVQNYDRAITFQNRGTGERSAQVFWVPLLGYARFIDNPRLSRHIVDLEQYYRDLQQGTLPAVAYMVAPAGGASEQAPGTVKSGQQPGSHFGDALKTMEVAEKILAQTLLLG